MIILSIARYSEILHVMVENFDHFALYVYISDTVQNKQFRFIITDITEYPKCLQTAGVTLYDSATCQRAHESRNFDPEIMFCAGVSLSLSEA